MEKKAKKKVPKKNIKKAEEPQVEKKVPISKTVEDTGLLDSYQFLKEKEYVKAQTSNVHFETVKEAEDSLRVEVEQAIRDHVTEVKQSISELQKAGYDLGLEGIKLLEVPLKVRMWAATGKKADLEIILNILEGVEKRIKPVQEENKRRLEAKEEKERAANLKEPIVKENTENA